MRVFLFLCLVAFALARWQRPFNFPDDSDEMAAFYPLFPDRYRHPMFEYQKLNHNKKKLGDEMGEGEGSSHEINTLEDVEQQLDDLERKPHLLTGTKNAKTMREAKNTAVTAKKLFAKTKDKLRVDFDSITTYHGGKVEIIVTKLSAMRKKLNLDELDSGEQKLLNHVLLEGISNEAIKLTGDTQEKLMRTLDKENAPMAAKVLVSQVLTQKLNDVTKEKIKKLVSQKTGLDLTNENFLKPGNVDQASYEATLNDAGGKETMQGALETGSKKTLCMFTPGSREYCVSQTKEL
ncbi:uncharacterized protein LOC125237170 [Leguminivora glycinivorella]|uniref:uncharacterized protein LOC125237170 n=1 Tax=Leguminivora glycinivorella TaxID=1035111 RepID=UPI00200DA7C5|nr:uncharacterized protein LOC125237170 [Leguminivora glycinivorella]